MLAFGTFIFTLVWFYGTTFFEIAKLKYCLMEIFKRETALPLCVAPHLRSDIYITLKLHTLSNWEMQCIEL